VDGAIRSDSWRHVDPSASNTAVKHRRRHRVRARRPRKGTIGEPSDTSRRLVGNEYRVAHHADIIAGRDLDQPAANRGTASSKWVDICEVELNHIVINVSGSVRGQGPGRIGTGIEGRAEWINSSDHIALSAVKLENRTAEPGIIEMAPHHHSVVNGF